MLVFDLGLAAAGAWLLSEGLASTPSAPAEGSATVKTGTSEPRPNAIAVTSKTAVVIPPAATPPAPVIAPAGSAAQGADGSGSGSAVAEPVTPEEPADAGSAQSRKKIKRKVTTGGKPIDPYTPPPSGPPVGPSPPPPPS